MSQSSSQAINFPQIALSPDEVSAYKRLGKDRVSDLIRIVDDYDCTYRWKDARSTYGSQFENTQFLEHQPHNTTSTSPSTLLKCTVFIDDTSPKEILYAIAKVKTRDARKTMRELHGARFINGRTLFQFPSSVAAARPAYSYRAIKWSAFKVRNEKKAMDFCYLEYAGKKKSLPGSTVAGFCIQESIVREREVPDLQKAYGYVRGRFAHTGIILSKTQQSSVVKVTSICQIDGDLPADVKTMLETLMGENICAIRRVKDLLERQRIDQLQFLVPADWVSKSDRKCCAVCLRKFVFHRKHNCRACGEVVCSVCAPFRTLQEPIRGEMELRVCAECMRQAGIGLHKIRPTASSNSQGMRDTSSSATDMHQEQNQMQAQNPNWYGMDSPIERKKPHVEFLPVESNNDPRHLMQYDERDHGREIELHQNALGEDDIYGNYDAIQPWYGNHMENPEDFEGGAYAYRKQREIDIEVARWRDRERQKEIDKMQEQHLYGMFQQEGRNMFYPPPENVDMEAVGLLARMTQSTQQLRNTINLTISEVDEYRGSFGDEDAYAEVYHQVNELQQLEAARLAQHPFADGQARHINGENFQNIAVMALAAASHTQEIGEQLLSSCHSGDIERIDSDSDGLDEIPDEDYEEYETFPGEEQVDDDDTPFADSNYERLMAAYNPGASIQNFDSSMLRKRDRTGSRESRKVQKSAKKLQIEQLKIELKRHQEEFERCQQQLAQFTQVMSDEDEHENNNNDPDDLQLNKVSHRPSRSSVQQSPSRLPPTIPRSDRSSSVAQKNGSPSTAIQTRTAGSTRSNSASTSSTSDRNSVPAHLVSELHSVMNNLDTPTSSTPSLNPSVGTPKVSGATIGSRSSTQSGTKGTSPPRTPSVTGNLKEIRRRQRQLQQRNLQARRDSNLDPNNEANGKIIHMEQSRPPLRPNDSYVPSESSSSPESSVATSHGGSHISGEGIENTVSSSASVAAKVMDPFAPLPTGATSRKSSERARSHTKGSVENYEGPDDVLGEFKNLQLRGSAFRSQSDKDSNPLFSSTSSYRSADEGSIIPLPRNLQRGSSNSMDLVMEIRSCLNVLKTECLSESEYLRKLKSLTTMLGSLKEDGAKSKFRTISYDAIGYIHLLETTPSVVKILKLSGYVSNSPHLIMRRVDKKHLGRILREIEAEMSK